MTSAWLLAGLGAAGVVLMVLASRWHNASDQPRTRQAATAVGWVCLLVALILFDFSVPRLVNSYLWQIIIKVGIYITLAVSLNIINGITGQFSMGHAGFMAVGAYTAAYLTMTIGANVQGWARWLPWNAPWAAFAGSSALKALPLGLGSGIIFLIALVTGGLTAAVAGYLVGIPSLRLRGDYLAIVTLGFGEIMRNLIANIESIGASRGLPAVPHYSNLFWVYLFAALSIFVSYRLLASAPGRAMLAVREDEIAAAAMGINTTRTKIQAFMIGTFFAGLAGGLLGHHFEYLHPDYFKFDKSFEVIIMVVLGGMGSVSGAAIAAVVIAIAPEALRYAKDLLGNLTEPGVLFAAAPFILFALIFLVLFTTDIVRTIITGTVRIVSSLRMRRGDALSHEAIVRLRRGSFTPATALIPGCFSYLPAVARDAGLGALAGLGTAIFHRALLGSSWNPRIEYWIFTIAGILAGAGLGKWMRDRAGAAGAAGTTRAAQAAGMTGAAEAAGMTGAAAAARTTGADGAAKPSGYRRLAAVGVLAPVGFLGAHMLEAGATDFLARVSDYFRNDFPDPRMVLYSIMLIALMLTRPTGLFGSSEVSAWWRERRARARGEA
jgi:branched-chain amino acid transport system permease protein